MRRSLFTPVTALVTLIATAVITACGGSSFTLGDTNPPQPPPIVSISGVITFKGAPLPGVTVTLWMTNDNSIHGTATTDSNGAYSFSGMSATGDVPGTYQLYAIKTGFGFYPSVGAGAQVIRFDHTDQFVHASAFGVPVYLTVIQFVATENNSVTDANFTAFDGANPPVNIAATGQTQSYAAGDDGALIEGVQWPEQRYIDNNNGTVTDQLTGLVWLKNAGCLSPAVWSDALNSVNALANGACGLSDGSAAGQWRMPNLVELESLIDPSKSNPAITPGNPFINVSTSLYWSSTSYFGGDEGTFNAWAIRLADGSYLNDGVLNLRASSINAVWAVRGAGSGQAKLQATGLYVPFQAGDDGALQMGVGLIYPRFIDHNDGTVTDTMTGLTWLKMANCIQGDWATALADINNLATGQCGLSDGSTAGQWRMPNRNEMQSLADRNQNNQAFYLNFTILNADQSVFQPAVFNNFMETQDYWTSTTDAADPAHAWAVFSCDFGVYDVDKSQTEYTLAVK